MSRKPPKMVSSVVPGEIEEEPADVFEAWLTIVRSGVGRGALSVRIPRDIARKLNLKRGDAVVVALRKATEEDYKKMILVEVGRSARVRVVAQCPKCGGWGSIYVHPDDCRLLIVHGRKHCEIGKLSEALARHPSLKPRVALYVAERKRVGTYEAIEKCVEESMLLS